MKYKKLMSIFLCWSLLINTYSLGFAYSAYGTECSSPIGVDISCIENLMDEELISGKSDFLIENVSSPNGSPETLICSSLKSEALNKLIKYLTPSMKREDFYQRCREIMKNENKKSSRRNIIFGTISAVSALFVSVFSFLKLDKIDKEKLSKQNLSVNSTINAGNESLSTQNLKTKIEEKDEKNSKGNFPCSNKVSKRNTLMNKAVSFLLGTGVASFIFIILQFIADALSPSQVPNMKEFNREYDTKILATKYILNAFKNCNPENYDSISIGLKGLSTENADITLFGTKNIGLNYSTEEKEEIQKNVETIKKQLEEIIEKYDQD